MRRISVFICFLFITGMLSGTACSASFDLGSFFKKKSGNKPQSSVNASAVTEDTEDYSYDTATLKKSEPVSRENDKTVDVNSADMNLLLTLPRMTREIASNIISYRNAWGPFRNIQDLLEVQGVDHRLLSALRGKIKFGKGYNISRSGQEVLTTPEVFLSRDSKIRRARMTPSPPEQVFEKPSEKTISKNPQKVSESKSRTKASQKKVQVSPIEHEVVD